MDSFSKVAAWATQSTTGQGFGIVAGVFAAVQSGSMTLAQAGPAILIGLILIVWPQKQAVAQSVGAVALDMEGLFSAYRTGMAHGASAAQAAIGAATNPAAASAVSDISNLIKAVNSAGATTMPVSPPSTPLPAALSAPGTPIPVSVVGATTPPSTPLAGLLAMLLMAGLLTACSTAQLQTESVRLAAINQILCQGAATAQPIVVNLASTIAVAADPADAGAVAVAIGVDKVAHDQLQAACPAGTAFLKAIGTTPATP